MNKENLKGVLVGAGWFAQFQAEAWRRLEGVTLTAIADLQADKAEAFAETHGIPRTYRSVEAMLEAEQPDFIDIATRPESHLELVRLAAAKKVHVICQKPMAATMQECQAMCEACDDAGVRLLIHENWRWQPWFQEVRQLIDSGTVGKPFQVAFFWRTGDGRGEAPYPNQPYFKDMPRLLVYETLVHILDTYRFLLGDIARLHCQISRVNPILAGEDQALIHVTFKSGQQGLIDANRITGPMPAPVAMGSLVLETDQAVVRMDPEGHLFLTRHGEAESRHDYPMTTEGYKGDSVFATQNHLLDCLKTGKPAQSEGRDYLKTVALVDACYDSARSGQVVELKG